MTSTKLVNTEDPAKAILRVVSKPGCMYCTEATAFLDTLEAPYVYEYLDPADEATYQARRDQLVGETGAKTFPFIFLNDTFLGGFQQLIHANDTGRLSEAYKTAGVTIRNVAF